MGDHTGQQEIASGATPQPSWLTGRATTSRFIDGAQRRRKHILRHKTARFTRGVGMNSTSHHSTCMAIRLTMVCCPFPFLSLRNLCPEVAGLRRIHKSDQARGPRKAKVCLECLGASCGALIRAGHLGTISVNPISSISALRPGAVRFI